MQLGAGPWGQARAPGSTSERSSSWLRASPKIRRHDRASHWRIRIWGRVVHIAKHETKSPCYQSAFAAAPRLSASQMEIGRPSQRAVVENRLTVVQTVRLQTSQKAWRGRPEGPVDSTSSVADSLSAAVRRRGACVGHPQLQIVLGLVLGRLGQLSDRIGGESQQRCV
jgi:hypothetical protein